MKFLLSLQRRVDLPGFQLCVCVFFLFFRTPSRKLDVSFSLSEAVMAMEKSETIPKDHKFVISNVNNQTLGVFSQTTRELLT